MTASIDAQLRFAIASKRLIEIAYGHVDVVKIERCAVTEQTFKGAIADQTHPRVEVLYARVE